MAVHGEQSSKKRKANSPIVGREKERREELESTMSDDQSLLGNEDGRTKSDESYKTVTSRGIQSNKKNERRSVFTTKKPDGAFRDEIVVEIQTIDQQPFKGSVTTKEARRLIFEEKLGFKRESLLGFYFSFSGCPIVTFKLNSQFDIDTLESIRTFNFERRFKAKGVEKVSVLQCMIRGIRSREGSSDYKDKGIRWIKVEGCEYRLEAKQITDWLSFFGEIMSDISEDTHEDSEDSDEGPPVGNGIYSVRMKLSREPPQFLPMFGKRIRLYYRGITKKCTNCFLPHQRKTCKNERVPWMEYVTTFMASHPEIPEEFYGKWAKVTQQPGTVNAETNEEKNAVNESQNEEPTNQQTGEEVVFNYSDTNTQEVLTKARTENAPKPSRISAKNQEQNQEQEVKKLVESLITSGISTEAIESSVREERKVEKTRQRSVSIGRGRGRPPKSQKE